MRRPRKPVLLCAITAFCLLSKATAEEESNAFVKDLQQFINTLSDQKYECKEFEADPVPEDQPPVLELADCDEKGARIDYGIKLASGKKPRRNHPLDGKFQLQFASSQENQQMKDGFRLGKCFLVHMARVDTVVGTFRKDKLQSAVELELRNGTVMKGHVKDNRLYGTLRIFHKDERAPKLEITEILQVGERGGIIIEKKDPNLVSVKLDEERTLVIYEDSLYINCIRSGANGLYLDCNKVESFSMSTRGCQLQVAVLEKTTDTYSIHALIGKVKKDTDPREGICSLDSNTSPKQAIGTWLEKLKGEGDPFWDIFPSKTPLSEENPRLDIKLPILRDRELFKLAPVVIVNGGEEVYRGRFRYGQIQGKVSDYRVQDWRGTLEFYNTDDQAGLSSALQAKSSSIGIGVVNPLIAGRLHLGQLHGPVRLYGQMSSDPNSTCTGKDQLMGVLHFFGIYEHGKPTGFAWKGIFGGGWLYGKLDEHGEFTGDDIAYIYPDLELALVGKFVKGVMIEAQESEVTGFECNGDMLELTFAEPHGPYYHYDPPTFTTYGDQPLLGDPLENKYVKLGHSDVTGAGQGLFATRDIEPGTIIATYGGIRVPTHNDTSGHTPYKISIKGCEYVMDVPKEVAESNGYLASLNHMVNHSFKPTTAFFPLESPRFGVLVGLKAIAHIKAGDELLCDYGYGFNTNLGWYTDLLKNHLGEEEYERQLAARNPVTNYAEELKE